MVILDRIPPYSAVNESVEIAKKYLPKKFHKFTNAVLRKAARLPFPVVKDGTSVEAASTACSHPEWLVERWRARWSMEDVVRLLRINLTPAPYCVWVNIHHTSLNSLRKQLRAEGIECRPAKLLGEEMLEILSTADITDHPLYKEGLITPQDPASRLVVKVLDPKPGEAILDACAAPGIKTAQIALAMENQGRVVACEISQQRYELLKENIARLGATIVEPYNDDVKELVKSLEDESFDKILVDAPCSDLGTIRRRPEIKWKRTPEDLEEFSNRQWEILKAVIPKLKIGGELVYSVCSFEEEESLRIVERVKKEGLELVSFKDLLPEELKEFEEGGYMFLLPNRSKTDGFFIMKARR